MGRSNVNAVQVGQDTKISIRSQNWGRKRIPLAQTFGITPKLAVGVVGEFDNRFPVLTYGTYEGASVNFEVFQADNGDVNAMMMDTNPAGPIVPMIEAIAIENQTSVWVNYYAPNLGYQYGWDYVNMCRPSANPNTQTPKDPAKITKTLEGAMHFGAVGKTGQKCALQYIRFVNGAVANNTADDVAMSAGSGTFPNAPVAFPLPTGANLGASQLYVDCYKSNFAAGLQPTQLNGNANIGAVDFTIVGSTFTPTVAPVSGDVYEIWVNVQPTTPVS